MNKLPIILLGDGGHASSCADVIERQGIYKIAGLIGLNQKSNRLSEKYISLGTDEKLQEISARYKYVCIGIGQIKDPTLRINKYNQLQTLGFNIPTIISPHAYISDDAQVMGGTIVMHHATINIHATIGSNCIINTGAILDHGVKIGNNCHISTGAILNGDVIVEDNVFVGSSCIIKQGVKVGFGSILGIGSIIKNDVPPLSVIK